MKLYNTIYMANPHDKKKWELVKDIDRQFLSADSTWIEDDVNAEWDDCIYNWDEMYDCDETTAIDTIDFRVIERIYKCDALILYIDNICPNVTALEVTYASTTGKPCYLIINNHGEQATHSMDMESGLITIFPQSKIHDSYWCLQGLQDVHTYTVNSLQTAQETARKILSIESPIEAMLLHEITNTRNYTNYTLHDIEPQFEIGNYRIDFAYPDAKLAIELDGHEYHKTKEQRTSDAKKDRRLIGKGWEVIRFTGSEIYNNVHKCMDEIEDHYHRKTYVKVIQPMPQFKTLMDRHRTKEEGCDLEIIQA